MEFNFDQIVDRTGTASLKWDFRAENTGIPDILPMWVADMDFPAPPEVVEAVKSRAAHGVYGYTGHPESFFQATRKWFGSVHNWEIKEESIIVTPGVVPAINLAIQTFTRPGEKIIIQPPVYYPFMWAVENNQREIAANQLVRVHDTWRMDLEDLENKIGAGASMLILCSPHNPVARVWTRKELEELAALCRRHDILIVSDEIHADLAMPGHIHLPLETVAPDLRERIITCTSPSKTFNLAGLQVSSTIIPDPGLHARFNTAMKTVGLGLSNPFGIVAAEAAYRHGRKWLDKLLAYIKANHTYLAGICREKIPWANPMPLEGTYLAWIDCHAAGLEDETLSKRLREKARVWLDEGPLFGPGGEGFQRMNLACPRAILARALERIAGIPVS
ncbi:MAG TPA: pyridoxal phosphate-dependent aminotransferase [Candidatus Aminicenantes bacterium]|nr:pyridoxal phosphate-dependent aminotransferase [Candidatus Aminicenantes bacterium]